MATETDNNEVKDAGVAKVGDGGHVRRLNFSSSSNPLKRIRNKKQAAWYGLLALIVLIGGWLLLKNVFHVGDKVYAQAAGHKVYRNEITALIGNNKGISYHDAATVLADKYLIEAIVKDKHITVTDQDLVAQYGKVVETQKKSNKYAYQNERNQVYFTKLAYYNRGIYEGKFLITNFSRHLEFYPALPEDKIHDPELGNPAAIARDRKYAGDLITKLYNEIKSGKITFDQAIQIEHNDPQVGVKAYPSQAHSGSFNTGDNGPLGVFNTATIRNRINGIKQGTMTRPFAVSVNLSVDGTGNETGDSYFLVIRMDKTTNSYINTEFGPYLQQEKQRLGYKVYV